MKRQFPLFISSLQQQNAPGTESVNSCRLLTSVQTEDCEGGAQDNARRSKQQSRCHTSFLREYWKNADSRMFQFGEEKGSVQLLAVCGETVSAPDRMPMCFLNGQGGILFGRFAHLITLEWRGWCCVRLTLLSAGCLSSYLFFTRSWRL
jgi:hypothetical protein